MQVFRNIFLFIAAITLIGCGGKNRSLDSGFGSSNSGQKSNTAPAKRFQEADPDGLTPIESAIELSKKYAALSEEAAKLRVENKNLEDEKTRLDQRTRELEQELTQAKKELSEANDLLVEMRIELNNWKSDILGFRGEMREADKVQIEALIKILKVLGGEVDNMASADPGPQEQDQ